MEQGTLAEILGVEREIRAQLDAAREQAGRWLESTRRALDQEHRERLAQIQSAATERRAAGLQAVRDRAAAERERAEAAAVGAAGLDDEVLRPIVRRHLGFLLPEAQR